jgi:hypothetical protein
MHRDHKVPFSFNRTWTLTASPTPGDLKALRNKMAAGSRCAIANSFIEHRLVPIKILQFKRTSATHLT